MLSRAEFDLAVRDALAKLYDPAHLETHPLLEPLVGRTAPDATRGAALRELLVETIEWLRPADCVPFGEPEWLNYRLMRARYLEAQHQSEVCRELGLSHTTFYRYHREALEAVANILWERAARAAAPAGAPDASPWSRAEEEAIKAAQGSQPQELDLNALLAGIHGTVAPLLEEEGGLSLAIEVPEAPTRLRGDPAILRQIILNVVCEGIRLRAGRALRLTLEADGQSTRWCLHGLDPTRLDEEALEDAIGYAVSRSLLKVLGGRAWAEAEPDGLGRLCFTLPNLRPRSVLIVDDNPHTLDLYRRYLEGGDYAVLLARDAREVRGHLAETIPDTILLDVLMPNEDGWKILQDLRASPETVDTPVIVCSVLTEPRLALALGAQAVLQKPVLQADLLRALEALSPR